MKKDTLNIAIVGAGMIGQCHAATIKDNPRAQLSCVCDVNLELAKKLAEVYGVPAISDYKSALGDTGIDAVIIATPPWLHYEMVMASINAGKHILCEKPMVIQPEQAYEMAAEAKSKGVVLADCSARHVRLNPRFVKIHEMIKQNKLGTIYLIKYTNRSRRNRSGIEYHPTAKWFLDKSKAGGGAGMNWGVYDLSFIYGLFDDGLELEEAVAFGNSDVDDVDPGAPVADVEVHLGGMLKFNSGLNVMWDTASACHGKPQSHIEIFGTRGGISVSPLNWDTFDLTYYDDGASGPREKKVEVEGLEEYLKTDMPYIVQDFIEAVLDGKKPAMPAESAAKVLKTLDTIYRKIKMR